MSAVPIHIEAIGLHNVRFFRSTLTGPRQPWHSIDDLYAAMCLPRNARRKIKADMARHKEWSKSLIQIVCGGDKITIAPHWMAQGLISMLIESGMCIPEFEHAYVSGMVKAMDVIMSGMAPQDQINYHIAAFRNENGDDPWGFERIVPVGEMDDGEVVYGLPDGDLVSEFGKVTGADTENVIPFPGGAK